jgi:hypothetical protein
MILPVSQFFAYLEVDETSGSTFDMPDSSLWTLYLGGWIAAARRMGALDIRSRSTLMNGQPSNVFSRS